MNLRALLDASPLSSVALALMREATGRDDPIEPLRPTRPAALRPSARVAFWSLVAGTGTSTTAALVAQRSAAAGAPPLLLDLDRWAPSLALRAKIEAATIGDLLVQPGREADLVSRWSAVPFVPGSPSLHAAFSADRLIAIIDRLASGCAVVIDLGSGRDALDGALLARCTRLVVVAGTRAAQLQALFCAQALLREVLCPVSLAVVGAAEDDARLVAARVAMPLAAAIPGDPYLEQDDFAARAPTMRAVDVLIRAL